MRSGTQKLDHNDGVCHETRVLVDILYFGLRFDQLNAGTWAVFELACRRLQAVISAYSDPSKMNWSTARLMTVDGLVQPALCGYAARRAREEYDWDLPRDRVAGIALGSGVGPDGIDAGADDGTGKSSSGGQKGRGVANTGEEPWHTRTPQATGSHDVSGAGVDQAGGS